MKRLTPGVSIMSAQAPTIPPIRASSICMCISEPFVVVCFPRPYFWLRLPVFSTTSLSSTFIMELFPTPLWPTRAERWFSKRDASSTMPSPVFALRRITL